MRKFNAYAVALFAAVAMLAGFSSCSKDSTSGDSLQEAMEQLDGLVRLNANSIGDWDEGFVCGEGSVLFKEGEGTKGKVKREALATDALSFITTDKQVTAHVFFAEDGLPSQMVCGDYTLFFNFLNDEVLELVFSDGKKYSYETTVPYNRADLMATVADRDFDCLFQTRLYYIVCLLDHAKVPAVFQPLVEKFKAICELILAKNQKATLQDLVDNGLLDEDGNAAFVEQVTQEFQDVVVKVHYAIMLWTGQASFKVGGTSCTLSGTVHCASPDFDTYGTYGIVCDKDPKKLYVEDAEYVEQGHQDGISTHFDVDIRGLKAKTTYYYRAYYKFNGSDHGDLNFRYGNPDADIAYDTVVKEFTTGENLLNVDVVMCIDYTGSMGGLISTVKENAMGFYDAFNKKCIDNGIQLASLNNKVIGFQDKNVDGDNWWRESPFYSMPDQRQEFNDFVGAIYADWGGDTPESGLEALDTAFDALKGVTDDGYHRQVIILWTDAPYLVGNEYTDLTVEMLKAKWDKLSTGRRLILFAPEGNYDCYNGGAYDEFDSWKNVIHSTEIGQSFNDFDFVLENIIGELIGKGNSKPAKKARLRKIVPSPNK